jgi:hypothetical protein
MTSTQFDSQLADRLERIQANPNPRGATWRCKTARFITWGKRHRLLVSLASLDRDAALDSARNVLAVLGVGTVLGDFATMRFWMAAPCVVIAFGIWYADYLRHF